MFKKTRLRIFGLIMIIATIIITSMLSVIYVANANYSYERGISLLESYINNSMKDFHPEFMPEPHGKGPDMRDDHNKMFNLSTFYSVTYNQDGDVVKTDYEGGILYSKEEILEITDDILSKNKVSGTYNKMPFLVKSSGSETIVALIDNTMEMDNSSRLFEYSFITGVVAWIIIFVFSWFFSKKIVNPLEINDYKQKQFISDASHELKTPISAINANADLLSLEVGENKWLSNIQYENERMGNLVKQLLELVRAENTQQIKENLDLSYLVSGGSLPFESIAFEKGLTLHTDIEENIHIDGNQNQMSQLISILIDNALEHGKDGKDVFVKLSSSKHHAILTVINEGNPIDEDIKNRLFERFYRVDEARNDETGHYGLGLAIAKAIVNAHNGKIEIDCHDHLIEFKVTLLKI